MPLFILFTQTSLRTFLLSCQSLPVILTYTNSQMLFSCSFDVLFNFAPPFPPFFFLLFSLVSVFPITVCVCVCGVCASDEVLCTMEGLHILSYLFACVWTVFSCGRNIFLCMHLCNICVCTSLLVCFCCVCVCILSGGLKPCTWGCIHIFSMNNICGCQRVLGLLSSHCSSCFLKCSFSHFLLIFLFLSFSSTLTFIPPSLLFFLEQFASDYLFWWDVFCSAYTEIKHGISSCVGGSGVTQKHEAGFRVNWLRL